MFYIYQCGTEKLIGQSNTEVGAFTIASKWLTDHPESSYDTFVSSTARGYSEVVGFGSTGKLEPTADETDPCTRGGSVLFGRETE